MATVNLPAAYLDLIREIMGTEYEAWMAALDAPLFRVVRLNPTKLDEQSFQDEFPEAIRLTDYPGLLYRMPDSETSLGNHPFHHAGCFYIQEPSATLPVVALGITKGDKVLDCCAAPGGKSTQILSELNGSGLLVSNEIDSQRNQTLRFNLQRFGDDNLLVTQNDTFVLGNAFRGYFDKILVDAPCSGMGMFRKDPTGIKYFSQKNIEHCERMQKDILENVYPALKENGILVYSTCTFTFEENEQQILSFIKRHPDMIIEELPFAIGRPGIDRNNVLLKARRITLLEGGEGHFICRLRKTGVQSMANISTLKPDQDDLVKRILDPWLDLAVRSHALNGHIYLSRCALPDAQNIKIAQAGVYLGEIVKGRIDPAQAFATSKIARDHFVQKCELSKAQTIEYLRGETLPVTDIKGFVLLTYRHQAIGFAKGDGILLKNHFPKGLRSFQRFSENKK